MARTRRAHAIAVLLGVSIAASRGTVSGQAPARSESTAPGAVGAGSFSPIVANLQKTLSFYALLGFSVP